MHRDHLLALSAIVLGSWIMLQLVLSRVRRAYVSHVMRARVRRAARGERLAEQLLEHHGYRVIDAQAVAPLVAVVDGASQSFPLRADFLVARHKRTYVAEVKTGALAPSLKTATTRRQLLEYRVAFPVDGVLLVDIEMGRIHEIVFPLNLRPNREKRRMLSWVLVAVLAIALFYSSTR